MKKLRESVLAKIVAWVLCIVSVLGTIAFGACLVLGISENLFGKTRTEALKREYERANAVYSIRAVQELGNRSWAEEMRENYFKYGIVKSDGLGDVDLHDRRSYLESNMTDEELADIDLDELYLYLIFKNEDGGTDGTRMGYYGEYADISDLENWSRDLKNHSEWSHHYADRICYDVTRGIVYYRAEGNYYPVQNVSLCYDGREGRMIYNYNYDFNSGGYKLNYKSPGEGTAWADAYTGEYADTEVEAADAS
ncbi:MAG: hypothetical protein NC311_20345, partial [Muribaculaceae bacterium]|nr:hypothetical protein [Muribaculaceae bacterium]